MNNLLGKTILNEFKIVSKISNGAFGEIFLTINKSTGEEFAAKVELMRAEHP